MTAWRDRDWIPLPNDPEGRAAVLAAFAAPKPARPREADSDRAKRKRVAKRRAKKGYR